MLSSFLLLTVVDGGAGPGSRRTTALHWQRPSGGSEGMARTLGVGAMVVGGPGSRQAGCEPAVAVKPGRMSAI